MNPDIEPTSINSDIRLALFGLDIGLALIDQ